MCMHALFPGAGLLAGAAFGVAALAACPGPGAALVEQFIAADCAGCWAGQPPAAVAARGWQLEWITPTGDDAPLAAVALPDAADRLQRAALPAPTASAAQVHRRTALQARPGLSLRVVAGPAWHGYVGLQLSLLPPARPAWPAGTTAWLALGTAAARQRRQCRIARAGAQRGRPAAAGHRPTRPAADPPAHPALARDGEA